MRNERWEAGAAALALAIGLAGCPHAVPASLEQALGTVPHDVSWRETVVIDGLVRLSFGVTQQIAGPTDAGGGKQVWHIAETEQKPEGMKVRARYDMVLGPDGYGYLASTDAEGKSVTWDPPELVLPASPVIGQKWSAKHTKGDRTIDRSCEIEASELCNGGLVSVCDGMMSDGNRTIVREHFCPGIGWSGYESLQTKDGHSERRWSEEMVRDGVSVP